MWSDKNTQFFLKELAASKRLSYTERFYNNKSCLVGLRHKGNGKVDCGNVGPFQLGRSLKQFLLKPENLMKQTMVAMSHGWGVRLKVFQLIIERILEN